MYRRLIPALGVLILTIVSSMVAPSVAQTPDDDIPIRPVIPEANRNDPNRVFLERAERLVAQSGTDYQILVGDVLFRKEGMYMYCDSAHFYDQTGAFDAFGNVRMEQGDTLFVYADELDYNDSTQLAVLYADPGKKVKLINRDVTLTTDVFNYDMGIELGYYEVGGELTDVKNRLTSVEGEYSPSTKEANFRDNVHLTSLSPTDTIEIFTNDLLYSTVTHEAFLTTQSKVINGDGTIYTTNGEYNTETTFAKLYDRSTVEAKNGNTITGDTLYYDRNAGWGEAFGDMELNDINGKRIMKGNYGFYNELTDSVFVTGRAMAIDYSQGDSLYFHGDTIRAFRVIVLPEPEEPVDKPFNVVPPHPEVSDAVSVELPDSILSDNTIVPDSIVSVFTDDVILPDSLASADFDDIMDIVADTVAIVALADSVVVTDSLIVANELEEELSDSLQIIDNQPLVRDVSLAEILEMEKSKAIPDTVRYVIAAPHVKFYRKDLQGLCDSMTFVSSDSMAHMNYNPVIWSENRQVFGDEINLHFNDSTIDKAIIPSGSFMAEIIEDGYFNQLSGKEMIATFEGGELRHLDVNGNVLAISFPEENDSTINKVTNIESSFLAADFKNSVMTRMRLWSETNASVTPLYLAKKSLFFLPAFKWWESERPMAPEEIFDFSPELLQTFAEARRTAPVPSQKAGARKEPKNQPPAAPPHPSELIEPAMPLEPVNEKETDADGEANLDNSEKLTIPTENENDASATSSGEGPDGFSR